MATDQEIRDAGFKYIPQQKYLQNPFELPENQEPPIVDQGIVNTNAFTNSGGVGNIYGGSPNELVRNYQSSVDARTQRLEDAYNNPSTAKAFGLNMFKQDVNPADAGFYVGEGMRIPQQRTMLGKMFQPQSPQEIMEQGYKPMTNIGILSSILGKVDKFGTLPRPDQAFITSQMGYTGPTVFGENASGLGKDPFGLNTRSGFGNYAEAVGEQVSNLEKALGADGAIGGKKDFQGATFNSSTGLFESDTLSKQDLAELNRRTNLVRTKLNFYRNKVKERDVFREQEEQRKMKAYQESQMKKERDIIQSRLEDTGVTSNNYNQAANIAGGGGGDTATYGGQTAREATYDNDPSTGTSQGYSQHYARGGRAGYFYGGRVNFKNGGLASIL